MKYPFIKSFEEEMGEPLISGLSGERLYYYAKWEDLHDEKEQQGVKQGDDVRVAGYVLNELGIPNQVSEADTDENGDWIVYWR